jgi:hypothetical protein
MNTWYFIKKICFKTGITTCLSFVLIFIVSSYFNFTNYKLLFLLYFAALYLWLFLAISSYKLNAQSEVSFRPVFVICFLTALIGIITFLTFFHFYCLSIDPYFLPHFYKVTDTNYSPSPVIIYLKILLTVILCSILISLSFLQRHSKPYK